MWRDYGGRQSLLSMHPQERLVPLVDKFAVGDYFIRVDGLVEQEVHRKAPHLLRYLDHLQVEPTEVLMIGDSVDDALAAQACAVRWVLYHAGLGALHAIEHFLDLNVPVATSLSGAF